MHSGANEWNYLRLQDAVSFRTPGTELDTAAIRRQLDRAPTDTRIVSRPARIELDSQRYGLLSTGYLAEQRGSPNRLCYPFPSVAYRLAVR